MTAPGKKKAPGGFTNKWSSEFGPYLTLGLQLAISVLVFFFLGLFLDREFGTAPWLMLAGIFVGVVGGLINFFRTVIPLGKAQDKEAEERRKHAPREH